MFLGLEKTNNIPAVFIMLLVTEEPELRVENRLRKVPGPPMPPDLQRPPDLKRPPGPLEAPRRFRLIVSAWFVQWNNIGVPQLFCLSK